MRTRHQFTFIIALAGALLAGCNEEDSAAEAGGQVSLDGESWTQIVPGVLERHAENGSVIHRFFGKDGFEWLAAQHSEEHARVAAAMDRAPAGDKARMQDQLAQIEELVASAQERADALAAQEEQGPGLSPQGEFSSGPRFYGAVTNGNYCYVYAEAGPDSVGLADGYAESYCPGNFYVNAYVYASSDLAPPNTWSMAWSPFVSRYGAAYYSSSVTIMACGDNPWWGECASYYRWP